MKPHRNSQKRIYIKDTCYSLASKTYGNFPYFREGIFCDLFIENLKLCKGLYGFLLFGWVLVYDHFHLLMLPENGRDISVIMQFLKRHVARNINIIMGFTSIEGDIGQCRLQDGVIVQKLHTFDKLILSLQTRFRIKYPNNPFLKFRWQKSFRDHYIRNKNDFINCMRYIAYNPEKHNLPSDWGYVFTNEKYEYLTDEP